MATSNPLNPLVSIIVDAKIQGGGSASAGAFTIFPGTNIINSTGGVAASVVISSATLNAAIASAWSAAGGGALT